MFDLLFEEGHPSLQNPNDLLRALGLEEPAQRLDGRLQGEAGGEADDETSPAAAETAAFILFGMMNWLYTWPRKLRRQPAPALAETVAAIFLGGFPGAGGAGLQDLRSRIVRSASPFWEGAAPSARSTS